MAASRTLQEAVMGDQQRDVIEVLEHDYREVEEMFAELESLRGASTDEAKSQRKELTEQVTIELVRHSVAEEVLIYPNPKGRGQGKCRGGPACAQGARGGRGDAAPAREAGRGRSCLRRRARHAHGRKRSSRARLLKPLLTGPRCHRAPPGSPREWVGLQASARLSPVRAAASVPRPRSSSRGRARTWPCWRAARRDCARLRSGSRTRACGRFACTPTSRGGTASSAPSLARLIGSGVSTWPSSRPRRPPSGASRRCRRTISTGA